MTTPPDTFFTRLRQDNPFDHNRVDRPSPAEVDVEAVHQAEFRKIAERARQAHVQKRGVGVVLWGEAGLGKSHLLSRLWRWAERNDHAAFVYLHNLQARAERLPRYVLKCVLSVLTEGRTRDFRGTALYRLVKAFIKGDLAANREGRYAVDDVEAAYRRQLDRLVAEDRPRVPVLDRAVFQALLRFYVSANLAHHTGEDDGVAALAVRWLSGDSLDYTQAIPLGLGPEADLGAPVVLEDDERVKLVLVALAEMALARGQPFFLCFDQQIDNSSPKQVAVLSRFLHELLDSARNLLVVNSGSQQAMLKFRTEGAISQPAWDRIAQYRIDLALIRREEGRAILKARLKRFLKRFAADEEVQTRVARDDLFPLGTAWFEERLRDKVEFRPREVINWARERWEQQQQALATDPPAAWLEHWAEVPAVPPPPPAPVDPDALIDARVHKEIARQKAIRTGSLATLPPSGENTAGLVRVLLRQCLNRPVPYAPLAVNQPLLASPGRPPLYDLLVRQHDPHGQELLTGLLFLVSSNATATTAVLRRLTEDTGRFDRTLLVTDQRQPLVLGTRKSARGRRYYQALVQLGPARFQHVTLTTGAYADLDALQAVVGQAQAGDLAVQLPDGTTRPLSEEDVIASHHRRGRYTAHPLLKRILFPAAQARGAAEPLHKEAAREAEPSAIRPAG